MIGRVIYTRCPRVEMGADGSEVDNVPAHSGCTPVDYPAISKTVYGLDGDLVGACGVV